MLLENHFVKDTDYILLTPQVKQTDYARGGHNKETIMLNVETFKRFCVKAGTKKADEIHGMGTCAKARLVPSRCVPLKPLPSPIIVVQKTNDFLHLFSLTHQKEGCGELRSPGWSAKKWINCK